MTTTADLGTPVPPPVFPSRDHDRRGSPLPPFAMISTRFMELRKRRGLMITLVAVTIGIPTVVLGIRLLLHAVDAKTYGPAGGFNVYTAFAAGVLYTFGFIVAATLGCNAGSVDLTDGMFRHLVVSGRSRLALYLARIPAGLAIIVPLVAIGFTIVCVVCVYAAPSSLNYDGVTMPAGLSQSQLETFATTHVKEIICDFPSDNALAGPALCAGTPAGGSGRRVIGGFGHRVIPGPAVPPGASVAATPAQLRAAAIHLADVAYPNYRTQFLFPSTSLMIKTGLWLELEAIIGFTVGLGLGSLLGQRTVAVVLMIVLEIILTPILIRVQIPHFLNAQRGVVGIATAHLEPGGLPLALGGGGGDFRVTESTTTAIVVILAWLIGWTVIGAWRMMTRDA